MLLFMSAGQEPIQKLVDTSVLDRHEIHPIAALFPLMSPGELIALSDDIKAGGLRQPVTRYQGSVLDGRNRLVACTLAGVEPAFEEWTPRGELDTPSAFVWSMNGTRRHLTASQRAALAAEMLARITAEREQIRHQLKTRKAAFSSADADVDQPVGAGAAKALSDPFTGVPGGPTTPRQGAGPAAKPDLLKGRAREQVAKTVGASPAYISDASTLRENYPETFKGVLTGEQSLQGAHREIVGKALKDGTLDDVNLRKGAIADTLRRLDGPVGKTAAEPKARIKLRRFGAVTSTRTTVVITATFGTPAAAEEYLNKLQDDARVITLDYQQPDETKPAASAKPARRGRAKTA